MSNHPIVVLRNLAAEITSRLTPEQVARLQDVLNQLQTAWTALEEQSKQIEYVTVVTDSDEISKIEEENPEEENQEPVSRDMHAMMPELRVPTGEIPIQQLVELMPDSGPDVPTEPSAEEFLQRINRQVENFARDLQISPRVLIVEDDPSNQELLVERLAEHEVLADVANSAEESIDRLSDKAYAVVMVGQSIPDADPEALIAKIRSAWPLLEILVCVPADDSAQAEAMLQAGASDYLPLPYPNSHYLNMKVRLSQARHGFETRINAVIQHLSGSFAKLAKKRGPDVYKTYLQSLKRSLDSYDTNAPDLRIVVMGTPQLSKAMRQLGHPVVEVKTSKEIEDMVRMGMTQIVVAVDQPGQADGVELMYRLRQISPTVGIFIVSTEMRLQVLVEAVGTTIGDFLLRPLEGRELFLPRLKKLISRQKQMTRYRLLLEELKVMNINLMNPTDEI